MNTPYKTQIENLIRNSEFGMTSSQIAVKLSIAWRTVNKYLKELVKEGRVTSHAVGPYSVFITRKLGEQPIFQLLYAAAIQIGASMIKGEAFRPAIVPKILRTTWQELGGQISVPFEKEIPRIQGPPTPQFLERLIEVTKRILGEFGYFGMYPKVETIPPLGNASPMTRYIQLKDPGFIRAGGWTHYHLLASFLEEKFTGLTGIPVFFHVAGEIKPDDEMVYFEIGLVEFYYLDFSIVEISDPSKDARFYLDIIRNFFAMFLRMKVREYSMGEVLHYKASLLNNQQIEEMFTFRARALRKNCEIFHKLHLQGSRKWVPYEDWPEHPFLVVDIESNVGFAVDDWFRAIKEMFPGIGYNIWVEKIPNGYRINLLEPFDFDTFVLSPLDEASIREHYRKLGIMSEEYLVQRKQALQDLGAELKKKHLDKLAQKRKKLKEMPETGI